MTCYPGHAPTFTASAPATERHTYPRATRPPPQPPVPPTAHAAATTSRPSWRPRSRWT
jgi:hypothetical protein